MSGAGRKLERKRKRSVDKCLFRQSKRFHDLKHAKPNLSQQEVWAEVVSIMSHRDLKVACQDLQDFKELPCSDHFVNLVQAALLEVAMANHTRTTQDYDPDLHS